MKKIFVVFLGLLFSGISSSAIAEKIIAYMDDHPQKGQILTSKKDAKYFRILLRDMGKEKYLIQDFYISGEKGTDPYIATDEQTRYVANEGNDDDGSFVPREGKRILWYKSGKKLADTNYRLNKKDGMWSFWYEDGKMNSKIPYKLGKRNGTEESWFPNGIKSGDCNYKDGLEEGRCRAWYVNGNLHYDGFYHNGRRVGIWKQWNIDGNLEKEETH